MEMNSRIAVGGAVVFAAAIAFLWFVVRGAGDVAAPPVAIAHPLVEPTSPSPEQGAMAAPASVADVPTATAGAPAEPRREFVIPAANTATLRGRCVDASGAPLADCKVHLQGWGANSERMEAWLQEHAEKPEWTNPEDILTGADGSFAFTFWPPPPFQFALDVRRDGCGALGGRWSALKEGSTTDVGDVVLSPGVRITGRVVDADGVPQAREYVTFDRRQRRNVDSERVGPRWGEQVVSSPDGTFATRGWLLPGDYEVRTQKLVLQSPKTLTLVAERPVEAITVVVAKAPKATMITGRVLDDTGAPARGVQIEDRSESGWTTARSNRDGTFELFRSDGDTHKQALLVLNSSSYDIDPEQRREVEWGATGVEFTVARAASLTLRVTDPQLAPVDTYIVRLIPRNRGSWGSVDSKARAQGKHEDGLVVVDGLTKGDWLLLVDFPSATGFESLSEEFHQDGGPRRMDLRAAPALHRELRVVAADDAPVAGTVVQLCDPFDKPLDDARFVMQRDHWLMNSGNNNALVLFEGTTDADGRLDLRGPGGRALGLCLLGPGHVPLRQEGVRLDAAGELVVRVSSGARLTGRIVPPEAVAELRRLAAGEECATFPDRSRPRLTLSAGQRRFPADHVSADKLQRLSIGDDGAFDADGLPPGNWQLQLMGMIASEDGGGMGHTFAAGEVTLIEGQTVQQDLDLGCVLPGEVDGLVLSNGQPYANDVVTLHNDGNWINFSTDAEGRFHRRMFAGDYTVLLQALQSGNRRAMLRCPTPLRVVRGQTTTQTFAVASTTLRVTVLDAAGKPVAGVPLSALGGDEDGSRLPATDDAGVAEAVLTTENVTLRILPKALSTPEAQRQLWQAAQARGDSDPFARHWILLQTVALVAGQVTAVEVRLPASAGY